MALATELNLENGLELSQAVLIIDQLTETKQTSNIYKLALTDKGYQSCNNPKEAIGCSFRVQIFANESMVRSLKQPISILPNGGSPVFSFLPKEGDLLVQAYEFLQTQYPDAKQLDLTEIGVQ